MRMTYVESILLGALEGITEFLPVSSTGHLILASNLLSLPESATLSSFIIAIQLGAILAVVLLFFREFLNLQVLLRLVLAFIPTGFVGLLLYPFIKNVLLGDPMIVVLALALGGAAIIAIERDHGKEKQEEIPITTLPLKKIFLIGCAQALAVIPGVSRSGATVMGGLLMKLPRATVLKFSFLLAVPTMLAATGYDLLKTPEALSGTSLPLIATGFITAFIVALATMKVALAFVRHHSFAPFGWYRIVLALLFWLIIL
jgi:undecaprenyl-diphosphatase